MRPLYLLLLRTLERWDSPVAGRCGRGLAGIASRLFDPLPRPIRKICDFSQPVDPLSRANSLPPIDLVVPVAAKDIPTLRLVLDGALATVRNPIGRIRLIRPRGSPNLPFDDRSCAVECDDDLMSSALRRAVDAIDRPAGKSWVIQQMLKILAVAGGPAPATLVLDADTVLLRPRVWYANGGEQILQCTHEYHRPYAVHWRRRFGGGSETFRLSYVTHHQLMQRDIIREMFGPDGIGLVEWLQCADFQQPSALSEYHSYGAFAMARHPRRVRLARWGNLASGDRRALLRSADYASVQARIQATHPGACSISFHSWMSG